MNNLFSELDKKDADEFEDISNAAVIAELNKPIALNKQDQMYNKYNITLGGGKAQGNEPEEQVMGPPTQAVGHNSVNPFSKKRKFDEVSVSNSAVNEQQPKSVNTTVFYDANGSENNISQDVYQSANDDSRMEIDTSSAVKRDSRVSETSIQ